MNINSRFKISRDGRNYIRYDCNRIRKNEVKFYSKIKNVNLIKITEQTAIMEVIDDIETLKMDCILGGQTFNKAKIATLLKRDYGLNNQKISTVISAYKNYLRNN